MECYRGRKEQKRKENKENSAREIVYFCHGSMGT